MNAPTRNQQITVRAEEIFGGIGDVIPKQLPANVRPERFQAAFMTAVYTNPDILRCKPESIQTALLKCASDGLVPDGRQAALVPYGGVATYLPMTQGIIARAKELGDAFSVTPNVIHANDTFHANLADPQNTTHEMPALDQERGRIVGAYVIFRGERDHVIHREIMTLSEIEKARSVSRAKNGPAWRNWYSEMARKTVIRRGSKYVPMSDKLRDIINRDDEMTDFGPEAAKDVTPGRNPLIEERRPEPQSADMPAEQTSEEAGEETIEPARPWVDLYEHDAAAADSEEKLAEATAKYQTDIDGAPPEDHARARDAWKKATARLRAPKPEPERTEGDTPVEGETVAA